ncbi:MAG: preprotein translocase subunit YajC [Coriobacteriia bacterium]|nr:preprotein translocase subunit YajC [Coriobacteriia bacterium]
MEVAVESGSNLNTIIFLLVLVAGMYVLIIRPNQQRSKKARELMERLAVGKRVMTAGGFYGTLRRVGDETVDIELTSGTVVELEKAAVAKLVEDEVGDA